jgi:glycosyltransferase involved in cell wall biosynthesis
MKFGIDLSGVPLTGPRADAVRAAVAPLLARAEHVVVLFHTVGNYHLFADAPAERHTFTDAHFARELGDFLTGSGDFDALFRAAPTAALEAFPRARQVALLEPLAESAHPDAKRAWRAHATRLGALAVRNEADRAALAADAWAAHTPCFVLSADALREALERAAAPRVRVKSPPVVSIVTPSFNQGAFVRATIDSVLSQNYPHIDYRVVDGGSTDDTLAVLKSYGDRVKWVSEKDRGQAHAINKGMAEARGEIRAYLNSDDVLRPGAVAKVVEHFDARPATDLIYGRDALIDATGRYAGTFPTEPYSFERLVGACCISQPATFWRKRLADAVGPFDESLHLVMDFDYWLRADRAGCALEHVPDVLASTRMHADTKTSAPGKRRDTFFREVFAVSRKHAGYVSTGYVYARLHAGLFARHPWLLRYEEPIVRVVQKWHHNRERCQLPRWRALANIARTERPHLLRALNPLGWFRARPAPALALGADLWLGPDATVAHTGGELRLTGVPARDGVLRVYRGGEVLAEVPLRANEGADVRLEVPAGRVRLSFSASEHLADGRRVAFRVRGTTLRVAA